MNQFKKTERFEFLLAKPDRAALKRLAKRRGASQGEVLCQLIREADKQQ